MKSPFSHTPHPSTSYYRGGYINIHAWCHLHMAQMQAPTSFTLPNLAQLVSLLHGVQSHDTLLSHGMQLWYYFISICVLNLRLVTHWPFRP